MTSPYNIPRHDAAYLIALLDGHPVPQLSAEDLQRLLFETLKLAGSISDNCRDWLDLTAIIHADVEPYAAEKLNIPTLRGALSAALVIPRVDCEDCCHTCAFRVGSPANQVEAVPDDILYCLENSQAFFCHDGEEDSESPFGEPAKERRACRGFLRAVKEGKFKPKAGGAPAET